MRAVADLVVVITDICVCGPLGERVGEGERDAGWCGGEVFGDIRDEEERGK